MIFLWDIFSGGRGMLKSLRNHETGSAACRHDHIQPGKKWRIPGAADAEKNKVSHDDQIYCS